MMTGKFGDASTEIVIEEFMQGEEASIFVLTDGDGAIYLPPAQDHKRVGDGDQGLNTGGMGSYAPAPVVTPRIMELVQTLIVEPLLSGMAEDGMPYQGVLYVGIMVTESGPKVVEFNARFGDPECQVPDGWVARRYRSGATHLRYWRACARTPRNRRDDGRQHVPNRALVW